VNVAPGIAPAKAPFVLNAAATAQANDAKVKL
jgi:hypothetical protein